MHHENVIEIDIQYVCAFQDMLFAVLQVICWWKYKIVQQQKYWALIIRSLCPSKSDLRKHLEKDKA